MERGRGRRGRGSGRDSSISGRGRGTSRAERKGGPYEHPPAAAAAKIKFLPVIITAHGASSTNTIIQSINHIFENHIFENHIDSIQKFIKYYPITDESICVPVVSGTEPQFAANPKNKTSTNQNFISRLYVDASRAHGESIANTFRGHANDNISKLKSQGFLQNWKVENPFPLTSLETNDLLLSFDPKARFGEGIGVNVMNISFPGCSNKGKLFTPELASQEICCTAFSKDGKTNEKCLSLNLPETLRESMIQYNALYFLLKAEFIMSKTPGRTILLSQIIILLWLLFYEDNTQIELFVLACRAPDSSSSVDPGSNSVDVGSVDVGSNSVDVGSRGSISSRWDNPGGSKKRTNRTNRTKQQKYKRSKKRKLGSSHFTRRNTNRVHAKL